MATNIAELERYTAEFRRGPQGWYSPTLVQRYTDNLNDSEDEIDIGRRIYEDAVRNLVDP